MAAGSNAVWAIDIGNNSLKALHLIDAGGVVEVIGFDTIQHGKILTSVKPLEREELIALSLRQFVRQNALDKDAIIVSVPSQNSFARFVNLPPVEQSVYLRLSGSKRPNRFLLILTRFNGIGN